MPTEDGPAIGIDLGTTNSAAANKIGDDIVVAEPDGGRTMRSAVTFEPGDNVVIAGNEAVDYLETDPEITLSSVKREMGTETTYEIDDESYTLTEYTPEMISSLILKKVIDGAEASFGSRPGSAVITVPADFPEPARRATRQAAAYADIDMLRLLPEPTAACGAYGLRDRDDPLETVAVYDLGGGTFDISLVEIVHEASLYEVQGTEGSQNLGGDDFDQRILDHVLSEFESEMGIDLADNHEAVERVRRASKGAKHKLSKADSAKVRVPFIAEGETLEQELTRETFEELTGDLVEETIDVCKDLFDALDEFDVEDVETVLLVGGSSKMPQVRDAVEDFFGMKPSREVNPDEAVAKGAAKQAAVLDSKSRLPGADSEEGTFIDVLPNSLGVKLANGNFDTILEKNEPLPVRETVKGYTTVEDNQTSARIQVYQGEEARAEDNEKIEEFILDNIREAPANVPDIAVKFEVDENGVLDAQAWDSSIGEEEGSGATVSIRPDDESDSDVARIREELPEVR